MRSLACRALCCLFVTASLYSQNTQDAEIVFRSRSQLVTFTLVATDKSGRPVKDLRSDELEVREAGKVMSLRLFRTQDATLPGTQQANLPKNFFSNHIHDGQELPTNVSVVLFDGLNTQTGDLLYARQQLLGFLKDLRSHDRVAVYALGNGLKILHDFTAPSENLIKKVTSASATPTRELDINSTDALFSDEAFAESLGQGDKFSGAEQTRQFFLRNRILRTVEALESIARRLQGVPGRKNLIWISSGFPAFDISDNPRVGTMTFGNEIRTAMRALNAADVAVYPVDAKGLTTAAPLNPRAALRGTMNPLATDVDLMSTGPLQDFATATGGRSFYNRNDLKRAMVDAVTDAQFTYLLGYYTDSAEEDRFQRISVKCTRPGVTLRHRRGYARAKVTNDSKARDQDLIRTLWSPLQSSGIPLDVVVEEPEPGKQEVVLQALIDVSALNIEQRKGKFVGAVEFTFLVKDDVATVTSWKRNTVTINVEPAQFKDLLAKGLIFRQKMDTSKGYLIVVAARDVFSEALGTVQLPLSKVEGLPRATP